MVEGTWLRVRGTTRHERVRVVPASKQAKVRGPRVQVEDRDRFLGEVSLVDMFRPYSAGAIRKMLKPVLDVALEKEVKDRNRLARATRQRIKERDGFICHYCGRHGITRNGTRVDPDGRSWHIDHVVPLVHGGAQDDGNLVLACMGCNTAKRAKDYEDFVSEVR